MKWFKRFVNDFSFDFGFVMALGCFCYYLMLGTGVALQASRGHVREFIPADPHFAVLCFIAMFLPAFVLFGLFYIHWSKNRLESHEDVVIGELLEDKETLKKLLK